MIESEVLIQKALKLAGEELVFANVTILGVSSSIIITTPNYGSPYDVQKQVNSFMVSGRDIFEAGIVPKDTFTYTAGGRIYTFVIVSFAEDLLGWIEMVVNLLTADVSDV